MQLDREALARIVAAAATLHERVGGGCEALAPGGSGEVDDRLARWRKRIAGGRSESFRRRLRAEGWTVARVRAALGPVRMRAGDPLPAWATIVGDAVSRFSAAAGHPDPAIHPGEPIPFAAVVLPCVAVARDLVSASPHLRLLTPAARVQLERALLRRLSRDWEEALGVERDAFAALADGTAPAWGNASARGDEAKETEDAFVAHLRAGGLARLLERLPVLARLAGTRVENWVAATTELLDRLAADRALLRRTFAGGRALGRVCAVEAELSDPHRGGRTVSVLRFQSGCRVVYKPRPLAMDAAWQELLRWLNARGAGPALRPLAVLDHGGHGWVEYAAAVPCLAEDAARFHERSGALLCLAYALGGSDLHAENVAACGADPVLVDVEMLFGAATRASGGDAAAAHRRSVLHTGLLPQWVPGPSGLARRQGGLVATGPVVGRKIRIASAPVAAETPQRPPEDARRVAAGFGRMYRALQRLRPALLAADGPLAAFEGAEVRVLRRATWLYDVLLRRLRHPAYLASGVEQGIEIDSLCRPWLAGAVPAGGWAALRAEHAALVAGDVPIFTTPVRGLLALSSPAHRLGLLCERDLEVQRRLIRLAYTGRAGGIRRPLAVASGAGGGGGDAFVLDTPPIRERPALVWGRDAGTDADEAPVDFADEALAIAEGLLRTAIRRPGGAVTWIGAAGTRGGSSFAPVGPAFAHGAAGIAFFLAACAARDGGARYRNAARRALRPLVLRLRQSGHAARLADELGIGGAAGVGGIIYALTRVAGLLGDDELLAAATAAARGISRAHVDADRVLDVYHGSAGAVLGLLALHGATGSGAVLEQAAECGHRLHAHVQSGGTMRGRGFAHGAPGVAHALLQLHRATGDAQFRADAEHAFAAPEPPVRGGVSRTAWCSGAAGVGLAHASALDLSATFDHGAALEGALPIVIRATVQPLDHPCCGNAGAIDLLLVAADRAGRPALRASAHGLATEMVRRARGRRSYATGIEDRYTPGFLQGASGIGYALLRAADPDPDLPCALLWE
ncbi:MAG TPA: type 2 lanthipeptide synthetase LanM family protein [Longimicrobium sp.]|nr:type 2 lanthipeptide synthetase LanM family protein [Longimicrobium sp.]